VPVPVGALVPILLFALSAACSRSFPRRSPSGARRSGVSSGAVSASAAGASVSVSGSLSLVSCSGDACSVTLGGRDSRAHVLGTTFGIAAVDGDRVTLRVDGWEVRCDLGRGVPVGRLRVTCTAAAGDTVTFTVERA